MSERGELTPLWSDGRIGEEAYGEFHLYANHTCPDGVEVKLRCTPTIYCADLMRKVRNDYETERAALTKRVEALEAESALWQSRAAERRQTCLKLVEEKQTLEAELAEARK